MGKYYLYQHVTGDTNKVFYIGIGTKPEGYNTGKTAYKRSRVKRKRTSLWNYIVEKHGYKIEIIEESDNYEYINNKEKILIAEMGKRCEKEGYLVNFKNGGTDRRGFKHSKETIEKLKKVAKGNKYALGMKHSEEEKKRMSERGKLRRHSDEGKKKISEGNKGKKHSEETKNKMSEIVKNRYKNNPNLSKLQGASCKKEIVCINLDNHSYKFYDGLKDASIDIGISIHAVYKNLKGKSKKVLKKFKFFYKNEYKKAFENNGILNLEINYE